MSAAEPSPDAAALWRLAAHQRAARDLEAAEASLRRLLALQPEHPQARADLALALLGMGRYREGWALYQDRPGRRRMLAQNLSFPEWRGEPLAGKRLLIFKEQGFGDQIMVARFIAGLDAAEVTYAGHPALERLFAPLGVRYLAPRGEVYRPEPHDYWVMPMSLPAILGAELETLPTAPYLHGTPRAAGGRIGLVWKGEPKAPNQRFRALPEPLAAELLAIPGVVSLAPEDTGAQDFQDTADLIAGLDLVVSVDTAAAHLAGAMGAKVLVLLAAHGLDWQWLRGRDDSPWYPSARLLRQPQPGDWRNVVDAVRLELA